MLWRLKLRLLPATATDSSRLFGRISWHLKSNPNPKLFACFPGNCGPLSLFACSSSLVRPFIDSVLHHSTFQPRTVRLSFLAVSYLHRFHRAPCSSACLHYLATMLPRSYLSTRAACSCLRRPYSPPQLAVCATPGELHNNHLMRRQLYPPFLPRTASTPSSTWRLPSLALL